MHYAYTYVCICLSTCSVVCTVYLKNSLIPKIIETQRCHIMISFKYFAACAIFLMYLHVIVACSYSLMLLLCVYVLNTDALLTYSPL